MGFLKKLGKFGQSIIDFGRGKRGLGNVVGTASEAVLGSHNFIANIARSTDKDVTSVVNKIGGWDNLALMAGSLLLGPAGTALTTGSGLLAGTSFASGLSAITGVTGALGTTASIAGAVGAGYTGRQEYKAIEQEKEDEEKVIKYSDITGILISSVKTIVDSVSYVLIAFVSISLIVSSIIVFVNSLSFLYAFSISVNVNFSAISTLTFKQSSFSPRLIARILCLAILETDSLLSFIYETFSPIYKSILFPSLFIYTCPWWITEVDGQYKSEFLPTTTKVGTYEVCDTAIDDYVNHIVDTSKDINKKLKIVVDCANGSASATAPILFDKLGILEQVKLDIDREKANE